MKRSRNEIGSGGGGIAACMLGFSVAYFVCYFILNWIYETKEDRKFGKKKQEEELRVITKEEVMKRGIGLHVFKCGGLFSSECKAVELYKDTIES